MKKIWITGSRGFIGKELVSVLEKKYQLFCITHKVEKKFEKQNDLIFLNFLNEYEIELLVKKLGIPDIFIHLGWASMEDSESDQHMSFNVDSSKILIKKLFGLGLEKFVFLGSRDEYGERVGCLSENMESLGKVSKYAKAKKIVAKYGFEQAQINQKKFLHIRLFNTYGHGQKISSLINTLFRNFQRNEVTHLGPCEHFRDYIHVAEVCKGIELLLNISNSETVNLGSGKFIKLKDFVNLFWKNIGGKKNLIVFEKEQIRKNDPVYPESFADINKLKELTGWEPSMKIEDGINETIAKLNENKSQLLKKS